MTNIILRIFSFYVQGFRRMRLGRLLWAIILIKLALLFGVLKLFFLPDYLDARFTSEEEKAEYVFENLLPVSQQRRLP
jgi:TM2 domain-containing membrane protein YozV